MCIIAWVPPNNHYYTKDVAKECAVSNRDGIGFAFAHRGIVKIYKGYQTVDDYWADFEPISKNFTTVSHFRLATHGDKKSKDNCHPFKISDTLCMAHNGIISIPMNKDETRSDTAVFVDEILKKLPPNFLEDKHLCDVISSYIGTGSKLCFLDGQGRTYWIHKKQGQEHEGCWFSNGGHKKYVYPNYKGSNYDNWGNPSKKYSTTMDGGKLIIPGVSGQLGDAINNVSSNIKEAVLKKDYLALLNGRRKYLNENKEDLINEIKEDPIYFNYSCTKCETEVLNTIGDAGVINCPDCGGITFQGEITEREYQESLLDKDNPSLCHICERMELCSDPGDDVKYCTSFIEGFSLDEEDESTNCVECALINMCQKPYPGIDAICPEFIPREKLSGYCNNCKAIYDNWDGYTICEQCGSYLIQVTKDDAEANQRDLTYTEEVQV